MLIPGAILGIFTAGLVFNYFSDNERILKIGLGVLALLFIAQAWLSLQWPIAHDEAPLFYEAFLMRAEGSIPYRDIFDFQMPGSFAAYYALGTLSGFNAFGIRILDMLILLSLIIITFFFMQRFGKMSAFAAATWSTSFALRKP